ncbi:hypothetical protein GQ600_16943 [Phytophthora cactorum]|nr:hypothetical protein GQ600_16943 [Phytophthora cactorum]
MNAGRLSESWMNGMYIRRRRQPLVTNAKAISVSPKLCLSCRVEEIQHRIFKTCDEWNKLMGGVNYHIRQPMIVTDSNAQKTDADGDILMSKDAVELLGRNWSAVCGLQGSAAEVQAQARQGNRNASAQLWKRNGQRRVLW